MVEIDPKNKTHLITKSNEFFLNDLNFMPVYEIKMLNSKIDYRKYDIFVGNDKEKESSK